MTAPKPEFPHTVAIDTQILIFALRETYADDNQRQLSLRARRLLQQIKAANSNIVLSMITVGEYLVGVDEHLRPSAGQACMEQYLIAPYNLRAALVTARLVPFAKTLVDGDRHILMADTKIVGSIVAYPCQIFFTHDTRCKQAVIASQCVEVKGLPEQLEFFDA